MTLKDTLKQLVKKELIDSKVLISSKYRISNVSSVNSDGTCIALVDGASVIATPLYPVVQGQEIMVIKGDSGKYSAVPTSPNTPPVEIIHPPFFSGKKVLRFLVDESRFVLPRVVIFRFQDEGSSNLFRANFPELGNPSSVTYGGVSFSRNGRLFSVVSVGSHNSGPVNILVNSYNLGGRQSTSNPINSGIGLYSISPKLSQSFSLNPPSSGTNIQSFDSYVDDNGDLYYLEVDTTNAPVPQTPFNGNLRIYLTASDAANGQGTSGGSFNAQAGAVVGSSTPITFFVVSDNSPGLSSNVSWITFSFTGSNLVWKVIVNPTGLAQGNYVGTVTNDQTGGGLGVTSSPVFLNIFALTTQLVLYKSLSGTNSPSIIGTLLLSNSIYSDYSRTRILNAIKGTVVMDRSAARTYDVFNVISGNPTPLFTTSFANGGLSPVLKNISSPRTEAYDGYSSTASDASFNVFPFLIRQSISDGSFDELNYANLPSSFEKIYSLITSKSNGFALSADSNLTVNAVRKISNIVPGNPGSVTLGDLVVDISPGQPDPTVVRSDINSAPVIALGIYVG